MTVNRYTFSKAERLCKKQDIDILFSKGQSFIAYPLRVIYQVIEEEGSVPVSILISVSKKRFKRAVHRNAVKRLVRESYRVRKYDLFELLKDKNKHLLIGFLYLDKEILPFKDMEKSMTKAIRILSEKIQ